MTVDLSEKVGLKVKLLDNNRLELAGGIDLDGMSERKFSDLAVVAADQDLKLSDEAAYYMYRNVHLPEDKENILGHNQRFDLTVIPAGDLGEEYIKTSGHYHPIKPGADVEYPELYYVVHGQATYLMQKHTLTGEITDVILARVSAGEAIIMPPFYGHVTINETDETLVMANWVEKNFSSVYGDYEKKRGGAYYIKNQRSKIKDQNEIEQNSNYSNLPELRVMQSKPAVLADLSGLPIYNYKDELDKIDLIVNPEDHIDDFAIDKSFHL